MIVTDLGEADVATYCKCLEDWSAEMEEAGERKREWYEEHRAKGLRVKLAKTDKGEAVGMIQYIPADCAPIQGRGVYYILCIWVHGYRQGVGNHQHRGVGKALLHAAEEDARALGAQGMAAWGVRVPAFMRARWFRRQGYRRVDSYGMVDLLLKEFAEGLEPPSFIWEAKRGEAGVGRVRITCLANGWCPAQNLVYERAKRVAALHPDRVEFLGIDTSRREALLEYGISDGLFVDARRIRTGPPPSYDRIRGIVERRLARLGPSGKERE